MKKIIFATMVAIAMLVGIQPVFAEQFIVPEVSTSDSQCYVLDLPAGATAETPEYAAPWQIPEVKAVESFDYATFSGKGWIRKFKNLGGISSFILTGYSNYAGDLVCTVAAYESTGGSASINKTSFTIYQNTTSNDSYYVTGSSSIDAVEILIPISCSGRIDIIWWLNHLLFWLILYFLGWVFAFCIKNRIITMFYY